MGKRYCIVYDREKCISAAACTAVAPRQWVMSDADFKADLIGAKKGKDGHYELEIGEDEVKENHEAADICPVKIIRIIALEDSEQ